MSCEFRLDSSLRGRAVSELLVALRNANPQLSQIRFATYKPEPKLSERLHNALTAEEEELRNAAVQICRGNGIPFWDALLGISISRASFPDRFLDVAYSHGGQPSARTFQVKREDVSLELISQMIRQLPDGFGLVVCSEVVTNAGMAHIPMLDFRCPVAPKNLKTLLRTLNLLGQEHGVLAESGRSYHFYGMRLLTPADWQQFMARALLFAPITDPRYIAHRLIDGECRLKVIDNKQGTIPRIVDVF